MKTHSSCQHSVSVQPYLVSVIVLPRELWEFDPLQVQLSDLTYASISVFIPLNFHPKIAFFLSLRIDVSVIFTGRKDDLVMAAIFSQFHMRIIK